MDDKELDGKRQLILEKAAGLFLERGFQRTSTKEIAEAGNISKATLYKYFSSKEELAMQVSFYLTEELLFRIEECRANSGLTAREMLKQGIIMRMERFAERSRLIDAFLYSFTPEQREQYIRDMNQNRLHIFLMFSELIADAYEIQEEATAWELTVNLNGQLKEINFLETLWEEHLDKEVIADFLLDTLTALIAQRRGKPSLLKEEKLAELRQCFLGERGVCKPLFQRKQLLQSIRRQAEQYAAQQREECLEALSLLEKEYERIVPKRVLMEAILAYLEKKPGLSDLCAALRELK